MMDTIFQTASMYGPSGLIILAAFWYILAKDKSHKEERKELTDVLARQHTEALEVTQSNITVITELKILLQNSRNGRG